MGLFLQVAISMDRYLTVRLSNWSNLLFDHKKAVYASIGIIGVIALGNFNIFFTFGVVRSLNDTEKFNCFTVNEASKWMDVWRTVSKL